MGKGTRRKELNQRRHRREKRLKERAKLASQSSNVETKK